VYGRWNGSIKYGFPIAMKEIWWARYSMSGEMKKS
jgi:hypothetical protein